MLSDVSDKKVLRKKQHNLTFPFCQYIILILYACTGREGGCTCICTFAYSEGGRVKNSHFSAYVIYGCPRTKIKYKIINKRNKVSHHY